MELSKNDPRSHRCSHHPPYGRGGLPMLQNRIMNFGKIVALNTLKTLKDAIGADVISLQVDDCIEKFLEQLKNIHWVKKISEHDEEIDFNVQQRETRIPEIVNLAQKKWQESSRVNLREPT